MRIGSGDSKELMSLYSKLNESSVANMGSGTPTAVVVPAPGSNAAGGAGVPKGRYPGLISNVGATGAQASGYEDSEEVSDEESIGMAMGQLLQTADRALSILQMLQSGKKLEGWTVSKITLAADYIQTVADYMEYNKAANDDQVDVIPITMEKIVSEKKIKQRLDPKCWKGYRKAGTKVKGDTRVNKCVKVKK